jgi:hypothetical protein
MATRQNSSDDTVKRLRAQLRAKGQKSPLRERVELAAKKGAPAYAGGLGIGYVEEVYGPEKGAQATAVMALGGLVSLFVLNPKEGSITETLLAGATGAGMATLARDHGATLGRYARVKQAQRQIEQELARQGEIDDVPSETLATDVVEDTTESVAS